MKTETPRQNGTVQGARHCFKECRLPDPLIVAEESLFKTTEKSLHCPIKLFSVIKF